MKIGKIHIKGFGVLSDFSLTDLDPGINVIYGSNESGKTTLFMFIERLLFGFPRGRKKDDYNPYTSVHGARTGGRLQLLLNGDRSFSVERYGKGEENLTHTDGSSATEEELRDILGHVPVEVYRDVFAIDLDDLKKLRENSMKRLYGAGLGLKNVSLTDVLKNIDDAAEKIFRSPRAMREINEKVKRLEEIRSDVRKLSGRKNQYDDLSVKLRDIQGEIAGKREAAGSLESELERLKMLKKAWDLWMDWQEATETLENLPALPGFPEDAILQLDNLVEQMDELGGAESETAEELVRSETELDFLKERLASNMADAQKLEGEALLGAVGEVQDRAESLQRDLARLTEKRHQLDKHVERKSGLEEKLAMAASSAPQTSGVPGLTVLGFLAVFVLGIFLIISGSWLMGIIAIVFSLIPAIYYLFLNKPKKQSALSVGLFKQQIAAQAVEMEELEKETGEIEAGIRKTAEQLGLSGFPDATSLQTLQSDLVEIREKLKTIQKDQKSLALRRDNLKQKKEEKQKLLEDLFQAANAENEQQLRRNATVFSERKQAEQKLHDAERNLKSLTSIELESLAAELEKTSLEQIESRIASLQKDHAATQEALDELLTEEGSIKQRLEQLEMDQVPMLRMKEEQVLAELEDLGEKWSVYRVARWMLERAREKYERERQPRVLKQAQHYFKCMTRGVYSRITCPSDQEKHPFIVFDERDLAKRRNILSRGTLEQLYLSLRFGLIKSYEESGTVLPVITDDVLVNFDPERALGAAESFLELSRSHQILFLTCHPGTVDIFKSLKPHISVHTFT